jgi:hypothetical protein
MHGIQTGVVVLVFVVVQIEPNTQLCAPGIQLELLATRQILSVSQVSCAPLLSIGQQGTLVEQAAPEIAHIPAGVTGPLVNNFLGATGIIVFESLRLLIVLVVVLLGIILLDLILLSLVFGITDKIFKLKLSKLIKPSNLIKLKLIKFINLTPI